MSRRGSASSSRAWASTGTRACASSGTADLDGYFRACNTLLAETDILWTKPSEMTFYGALGLPLLLAPPVGAQERYNRRWAVENGAGLEQRDPRFTGEWIAEWLADGTLASAAWAGFRRLPKLGLYRILDQLQVNVVQSTVSDGSVQLS